MEIPSTSSPSASPSAAAHKIEMVFRFWSPRSPNGAEGESFNRFPGVLALIEDVVGAKRATVLMGREQLSVAGLQRASDALVVSRQIQHGLQGFRRKSGIEPVAVSIAINAATVSHAAENPPEGASEHGAQPSRDLVSLLKISKPAQVLVTHDLSREIGAYRGLPLRAFPGRFGVSEYLWTGQDKLDLLQSEPQLTLTAIPVLPERPPSTPEPVQAATPTAPALPPPATEEISPPMSRFRSVEEPERKWWTTLGDRKKIAAVAAAVVVFSGGLWGMYAIFRSALKIAPAASHPSTSVSEPAAPSPGTAVPPSTPPKGGPAEKAAAGAASVTHQLTSAIKSLVRTPPADARKGNCELGTTEVQQYLRIAEDKREQRQYAEAERLFRRVLACDSTNHVAQAGLERTQAAEEQEHQ